MSNKIGTLAMIVWVLCSVFGFDAGADCSLGKALQIEEARMNLQFELDGMKIKRTLGGHQDLIAHQMEIQVKLPKGKAMVSDAEAVELLREATQAKSEAKLIPDLDNPTKLYVRKSGHYYAFEVSAGESKTTYRLRLVSNEFPKEFDPETYLLATGDKIPTRLSPRELRRVEALQAAQQERLPVAFPTDPSVSGLTRQQLAQEKRLFFEPPLNSLGGKVEKVRWPNGQLGYLDTDGNLWVQGESRTAGEPFEWDVQLKNGGRDAPDWLRSLCADGKHINVSLTGKVTHRAKIK